MIKIPDKTGTKHLLSITLVFVSLIFAFSLPVNASYPENQIVTAMIIPAVQNNTAYVPIKKILLALSAQEEFINTDEILTINHDGRKIMMQLNNRNAKVNDKDFLLDSAPYSDNGDFWVPLNFISEALDMNFAYNSGNNTFTLTKHKKFVGKDGMDYIPDININSDLSAFTHVPYLRIYTDESWNENGETLILNANDSVRWKYTNTTMPILLSNVQNGKIPNTGYAIGVYAEIFTEKGNYLKITLKNKNPWNNDYIDIPINAIIGNDVGSVSVNVKRVNLNKSSDFVVSHIIQSISGVSINKPHLYLPIYDEEKLTYIIYPRTVLNKDVQWKSSDVNVATVDENGLIRGEKKGKTTVTVTSLTNGKSASCQVEVVDSYYDDVFDYNSNTEKIKVIDIPIPKLLYRDKGLTFTINFKNKGEWNIPTELDVLLANQRNFLKPWMSYSNETVADLQVINENTITITIKSNEGWNNDVVHIPLNLKLYDPGRLIYVDVRSENEEISPATFTFTLN